MTAPFTSEVFARLYRNEVVDASIVIWAEEMVLAGFESEHINILLGEVAPFNSFEMNTLLKRVGKELNIPGIHSASEAIEIIATSYVKRLIFGKTGSEVALAALAKLYLENGITDDLDDFYLLHHAQTDLTWAEFSFHLPSVNNGNIEQTIHDKCIAWLDAHPLSNWSIVEWWPKDQTSHSH